MDFTQQSPVVLSLCPGLRGLERGLERIFRSVRVAAYVEIEAFIVENLLSAMEAGLVAPAPIWTNLKTFEPAPLRGSIDILLGGYPCQPFSLAGNRLGEYDPRHLFPYIYTIVEKVRPRVCFFENVAGHLSMGYESVYKSLRKLGYRVESGIYSAEEVGAPHRRDRLFILAIMEDTCSVRGNRRDNGNPQRSGCKNKVKGSVSSLENTIEYGSWRNNQRGFQSKIVGTSTELGNTQGFDKWNDGDKSRSTEGSDRRSSDKLADSLCVSGEQVQAQERESELRSKSFSNGSEGRSELADTNHNGQDGAQNGESLDSGNDRSASRTKEFFKSEGFGNKRDNDRFPAGQGAFQYDWEEPRTIESSVVYTIDGYNFTEDLHRAIGNSVVEQTAELAFRDLWSKHFPDQHFKHTLPTTNEVNKTI